MRLYGIYFQDQDSFFECLGTTKGKTILQKLTPDSPTELLLDVLKTIEVNDQCPIIRMGAEGMAFGFKWNSDLSSEESRKAKNEYDKFFEENFPSKCSLIMSK